MKHNNSDSQLAAALNKPGVSGKQPDYKTIRAAAVKYSDDMCKMFEPDTETKKYCTNDFIAGAQWALSQVACASSAVDKTVSDGVNGGQQRDLDIYQNLIEP